MGQARVPTRNCKGILAEVRHGDRNPEEDPVVGRSASNQSLAGYSPLVVHHGNPEDGGHRKTEAVRDPNNLQVPFETDPAARTRQAARGNPAGLAAGNPRDSPFL